MGFKVEQSSTIGTYGFDTGCRVISRIYVELAGLADGREDHLSDPLAERLGLRGMASEEHPIRLSFRKHNGRLAYRTTIIV